MDERRSGRGPGCSKRDATLDPFQIGAGLDPMPVNEGLNRPSARELSLGNPDEFLGRGIS